MAKGLGGGGNSQGGRGGRGAGVSSMGPEGGRDNLNQMMQSPRPNFKGPGMPPMSGTPPQFLDLMFSMLPDPVRAKIAGMNPSNIQAPALAPVTGQQPTPWPAPGSAQMMRGGGPGDQYQRLLALFGNGG